MKYRVTYYHRLLVGLSGRAKFDGLTHKDLTAGATADVFMADLTRRNIPHTLGVETDAPKPVTQALI
jgi:hypothetical protein